MHEFLNILNSWLLKPLTRECFLMKLPGTRLASPSLPPFQVKRFPSAVGQKTNCRSMPRFSQYSYEKCRLDKTWFRPSHNWLFYPKCWVNDFMTAYTEGSSITGSCRPQSWLVSVSQVCEYLGSIHTGWIALDLKNAEQSWMMN